MRSAVIAYIYSSAPSIDKWSEFIRGITSDNFKEGTVVGLLVPSNSRFVDHFKAEDGEGGRHELVWE